MFRIRQPISSRTRWIIMLTSAVLCVVAYDLLAIYTTTSALPSFKEMGEALIKVTTPQGYYGNIWLWEDLKATYGRLLFAMTLGSIIGVVLGVLMGCFEWIEAFLYPVLGVFLAYVPSTALIPVLAVFCGTSENLFLVLLSLSIAPALACRLALAIKHDLAIERIDKTYTLGASHAEVVWNVVIRQILPRIIDNIRQQLGPAVVAVFAAELFIASVGFGYRIRIQSRQLHWAVVYVYMGILTINGFLLDNGFIQLRKRLCVWFEKRK